MIAVAEEKVHSIKDLDSLVRFLRVELNWQLPEGEISDITFDWTGAELNLSEDIHKKLKDGLVRQFQLFRTDQPWGIFVVDFADPKISVLSLRQMLRSLVSKKRGQSPDHPSWDLPNLLFICLYGENGFSFAHFKGDKPFGSRLSTFSWHPGDPIRTVCEYNLSALEYTDDWTPDKWAEEWQKAFDVEKVNKLFYQHIAKLYYRLTGKNSHTKELVLPSQGEKPKAKDYEEFAVRLIGRTIFCWFLKHKKSDKGMPLIPSEVLSLAAVKENPDYYHSVLEPLFFEAMNKEKSVRKRLNLPKSDSIPFLNGGLFETHPNDFYNGAPAYSLKMNNQWFVDFFNILEQYNFTIDENSSIDVEVSVDPEMLGRVFENLLAEVVPETGETARKATGSYYTPRVIVDYMVEQSLRQYLLTKTKLGENKIDRLLAYGEEIGDFTPADKLAVVKALTEIKVIDPACGSGAFPIGALHRMLMAMEKVDPHLELWRKQYLVALDPMVRQTVEKNIRKENWAYIRKLMIIRDAVYGVDIQPIAVEIAKLRCFLSLVVDEIVSDDEENRGVESLPNLEFKFVAANTLIGLPSKVNDFGAFDTRDLTDKLRTIRKEYLTTGGRRKEQLKKDFLNAQGELREKIDWALPSSQSTALAVWDPFSYESNSWFNPEWMFGISDGFDVVIANPPYVKKENLGASVIASLTNSFFETHNGKTKSWTDDLYVHFIFKGFDFTKLSGVISYICNDSFIALSSKERVRELMLANCLVKVIRCPKETFEAMIYAAVFVAQKTISCQRYESGYFEYPGYRFVADGYVPYAIALSLPDKRLVRYSGILSIIQKLQNKPHFKDYFDVLDTGIHSGNVRDNVFFKDNVKKNLSKLLQGKQVNQYIVAWDDPGARYKYCDINYVPQDLPGVGRKGKPSKHQEYWHFCGKIENHHKPERLLMRQTDDDLVVAYHNEEKMGRYYTDNTLFTILPKEGKLVSLKYALGLLNSRLMNTVYKFLSQEEGKTLAQIKIQLVNELPFVVSHEKEIIEKVDDALSLTGSADYFGNTEKMKMVEDIKEQINKIVFQAYALAEEEIKLINSNKALG